MRAFPLAIMLCLSGCASTQDVLSSPPKETVRSNKSAQEVAFCIANKNNVPVLDGPSGEKIIQIKNGMGAVAMAFSIYPDGEGSRIEIREPIVINIAAHRQCY